METALQIQTALRSHSLPIPSQAWLLTLVTSSRHGATNPARQTTTTPTLGSLIMTARTRLLASDLTTPQLLDPSVLTEQTFPPQLVSPSAASIPQILLNRDVIVQILDIENLNRSRWEQVEELEAIERGEQTRGRQVIRLPTSNDNDEDEADLGDTADTQQLNTQQTTTSAGGGGGTAADAAARAIAREKEKQAKNATHKLVVQDAKGQKMFALELKRIDKIAVGTTLIGEKLLLKSSLVVARGVLLIEPSNCQVLGGKVDAWHKSWVEGRLAKLRDAVGGADSR